MSKRYRNKPPKNIIDLLAGRPMLRRLTQDDIEYAISYEIEALLHAEITRQEISTSHLDFFKLSKHALIRRHISKRARSNLPALSTIAQDVGVKFGIFKGASLSSDLYPSVDARVYNDIDVFLSGNDPIALHAFFLRLGRSDRSSTALAKLAEAGLPIHEIAGFISGTNFDLHFNPFGIITPLRAAEMTFEHGMAREISLGRGSTVRSASLELELLISLLNLVRRGGGALRFYADSARLLMRDDFKPAAFWKLAKAEGLYHLASQAMLSIQDDLNLELPPQMRDSAAKNRLWWAPRIGESSNGDFLHRRAPLHSLRLDSVGTRELRSLCSWYLPTPLQRRARYC